MNTRSSFRAISGTILERNLQTTPYRKGRSVGDGERPSQLYDNFFTIPKNLQKNLASMQALVYTRGSTFLSHSQVRVCVCVYVRGRVC